MLAKQQRHRADESASESVITLLYIIKQSWRAKGRELIVGNLKNSTLITVCVRRGATARQRYLSDVRSESFHNYYKFFSKSLVKNILLNPIVIIEGFSTRESRAVIDFTVEKSIFKDNDSYVSAIFDLRWIREQCARIARPTIKFV